MYLYSNLLSYSDVAEFNWDLSLDKMEYVCVETERAYELYMRVGKKVEVREAVEDLGYVKVKVYYVEDVSCIEDMSCILEKAGDKEIQESGRSQEGKKFQESKNFQEKLKEISESMLSFYQKKAREGMLEDIMYRILLQLQERGYVFLDGGIVLKTTVQENKKRFSVEDVLMQEWGMGYWRVSGIKMEEVDVRVGWTYKLDIGERKVCVPGIYTVQLRDALMKDLRERLRTKEKGVIPSFQRGQYEVVKEFSHKNVIAGPRRFGKTLVSSYIALRELMKENYFGRDIRVLYVGITKQKTETVWRYINSMTKNTFQRAGVINLRTAEGRRIVEFIENMQGRKKTVSGQIELLSAESKASGIGEYADLIIIDEAARIPEEMYLDVQPIVDLEGAKAFIISTITWDTPKNWFYQMLLKGEKWKMVEREEKRRRWLEKVYEVLFKLNEGTEDEKVVEERFKKNHKDIFFELYEYWKDIEWNAERFTIDDIEWLGEKEKEREKTNLREMDLKRYYCELYAIFPSGGKVFNTEGRITDKLSGQYKKIYIGYDPAKLQDSAGVVVMGLTEEGYIEIIKEKRMKGLDYKLQIEELKRLIEEVKERWGEATIVMDVSGVGQGVVELMMEMDLKVDVGIMWKGSGQRKYQNGIWYVPREEMFETARVLFDRKKVKIFCECKELLEELNGFEYIQTERGGRYEATTKYDDLTAAFLVCVYNITHLEGYMMEIFTEEYKKIKMTYEKMHKILKEKIERQNRRKEEKLRQALLMW